MRTICLDARMLSSGGIGTYIRNLIPHIGNAFHLTLLVLPEQFNTPFLDKYKKISVPSNIYSIQEQFMLPLRIPNCDLYWSPHYNIPILPIRAKKRIVTIHDVYHLAFASSLSILEKNYAKTIMNQAVAKSDKIITVSYFSASELLKHTKARPDKIKPIYSGIETNLFKITPKKTNALLPYFLFVGNFKAHKNLKGIIEAFRLFLKENEAELWLVGKYKSLRNHENIDSLLGSDPVFKGKIKILENVSNEELPSLYVHAEALLFPSFYEGFGFPPLEALACGCPVIVSDIEVLREVCQAATHFVNPHSPEDIKEKMVDIWQNKDPLKVQIGKEWAASFSWEKSAHQHIELFESLCM